MGGGQPENFQIFRLVSICTGDYDLHGGFGLFLVNSFIFLFLENYGVRKLEAVFAVLIGTMALSFAWMFGDTKPNGKELLIGSFLIQLSCLFSCRFVNEYG